MDDLKEAISRTNTLLEELLKRDISAREKAEKRMEEFKASMPGRTEGLRKQVDEVLAETRAAPSGQFEGRMAEMRQRAEEVGRKQLEFQEQTLALLEEQNRLLRQLIERS